MTDDPTWSLHPQLAQDTVPVADLPLAHLLLMNDANYPWLILVPRRPGAVEIIDLAEPDQLDLMREIAAAGAALRAVTACHKLNVAALGNMVAQLHVHVIGRFQHDAAWPRPVWGAVPAVSYEPAARDRLVAELRRAIGPG